MEESKERFDEVLAILEQAWTQPRVNFEGKFYSIRDQVVVPRPVQKPHPKFFSTIRDARAAQRGWGVLTPPVYPHSHMEEDITRYVTDCRVHGHTPDVVYIRAVYIDEDPNRARREADTAIRNFFAYNASPRATLPPKEELERKGYPFYATDTLEALARLSVDELIDREIVLVGTPDQVAEKAHRILQIPGVSELAIIANYGGIEHWKALKTQELFARRVMPAMGLERRS
jgi:alkanesulfonate monooxygenase SsuD/methylene tetrahydromethanopterin reductase-like flavin-dependent oxidoreductase (luciferase family)